MIGGEQRTSHDLRGLHDKPMRCDQHHIASTMMMPARAEYGLKDTDADADKKQLTSDSSDATQAPTHAVGKDIRCLHGSPVLISCIEMHSALHLPSERSLPCTQLHANQHSGCVSVQQLRQKCTASIAVEQSHLD